MLARNEICVRIQDNSELGTFPWSLSRKHFGRWYWNIHLLDNHGNTQDQSRPLLSCRQLALPRSHSHTLRLRGGVWWRRQVAHFIKHSTQRACKIQSSLSNYFTHYFNRIAVYNYVYSMQAVIMWYSLRWDYISIDA